MAFLLHNAQISRTDRMTISISKRCFKRWLLLISWVKFPRVPQDLNWHYEKKITLKEIGGTKCKFAKCRGNFYLNTIFHSAEKACN